MMELKWWQREAGQSESMPSDPYNKQTAQFPKTAPSPGPGVQTLDAGGDVAHLILTEFFSND